ncbi:hypothetical protein EV127DRAFT_487719 [Xylaria flabelliformis]|nr:hypothetical protein EV127DRAFT_487719 [Xylaria flabelliformis]
MVDQPGLEVAPSTPPEAVSYLPSTLKSFPATSYTALEAVPPQQPDVNHTQALRTRRSKKKITLWIVILFLVIVVVAAILGGVLGSRRSGNSSPTLASPSPTSTSMPPDSPRSNSRLTASGWRTNGGFFKLRVFY